MKHDRQERISAVALLEASRAFGVTLDELQGRNLSGGLWQARAVVAVILYRHGLSWERIGAVFDRSGSSARNGVRRLADEILGDVELSTRFELVGRAVEKAARISAPGVH